MEYGREKSHTSHKVSGSGASLRVSQLRPGTQHQFWVTAATVKGEGRSSQVVSKTPSSRHLTQITDIGREIYTSWRSQVSFDFYELLLFRKLIHFSFAGAPELRTLWLRLAPHQMVFPGEGGHLGQPGLAVWPQPAKDRVCKAGGLRQLHLRHREHGAP